MLLTLCYSVSLAFIIMHHISSASQQQHQKQEAPVEQDFLAQLNHHDLYTLGFEFATQYYNVMHSNPEDLHRFYLDDSVMSFHEFVAQTHVNHKDDTPNNDRYTPTTAKGQLQIHNLISSLKLEQCTVKVYQLDVQKICSNNLVLQVSGEIAKNTNSPVRRFMQSFILVARASDIYVHNDIFQ